MFFSHKETNVHRKELFRNQKQPSPNYMAQFPGMKNRRRKLYDDKK